MTSELLAHTDEATRPQDDLYRHVNGAWLQTATIPDDKPGTGAFIELRDNAEEAVRDIITSLGDPGDQTGTPQRRIASLYASFVDTDTVAERGAEPLAPLLATADEITDATSLAHWMGWATRRGIRTLVGMSVDADPGDPQQVILFLGQSGIGLPDEEYYRDDTYAEIREAYTAHLGRMFELIGSDDPAGEAARVLELETAIAALHWDKVRTRDLRQMYNPQTRDELAAASPGLDWAQLLAGAELDDAVLARVVNAQPSYFAGLGELLAATPAQTWRAWARWQTASAFAGYLDDRFVAEDFAFYGTTLSGTPTLKERWKRGVDLVEASIGEDVGKLYVDKHFSPAAKDRMDELVANLIEAYRQSISELDWMTEDTRAEALRKLDRFRPKIGYPVKWKDYSTLDLRADDLVGNVLAVASWQLDDQLDKLTRPTDPDEWFMTPQTVNAYYHPLRNEIVFPAAILQPPFFDPEADDALNYGGIGAVIGHEIGHGFDDQGSTCDGDGALRNWWTDADRAAFEERTTALVGQYAELSPEGADGRPVKGELTIGENIGDLGGLSIAHKAWRLSGADPDAEIDGVPAGRRLFLNWAAVWRSKMRPEAVKQRLATDPHSPPEFRANQTVRNVDAFHEAFGTDGDDELWLPPDRRVKIW